MKATTETKMEERKQQQQVDYSRRFLLEGNSNDIMALQVMYESLKIDESSHINDWFVTITNSTTSTSHSSICDFTGIECDNNQNDDRRITTIDLTSTNLRGTIPTEIGLLSEIERLGLSRNRIQGTLPIEILNLSKLQHLEVNRNELTGSIFNDWSSLSDLKRILIQSNSLGGNIDDSICGLSNLKSFDLYNNPLTGTLPSCIATGGNNPNLSNIRIHDTLLTGTIPNGLCSIEDINGLNPNPYGCDAIACGVGYYSPSSSEGRQYSSTTACEICPTSTYLGSTVCPPSSSPTTYPSALPTIEFSISPTVSRMPSINPTFQASSGPTSQPSESPSLNPTKVISDSPSGVPSEAPSMIPSSESPTPTSLNGDDPADGSRFDDDYSYDFDGIMISPFPISIQTFMPVSPGPTLTPQQQGDDDGDAASPFDSSSSSSSSATTTNWALLTAACILSILALITVFLVKKIGQDWWLRKRQQQQIRYHDHHTIVDDEAVVTPSSTAQSQEEEEVDSDRREAVSYDIISLESEGGWNDTESSLSVGGDIGGDESPWTVRAIMTDLQSPTSILGPRRSWSGDCGSISTRDLYV